MDTPPTTSLRTPGSRRPPRRASRRWLPYLGALVLIGLIVFGLWPRPLEVETATAQIGPLRTTINEEGKTRIKQRYAVSAPVSGHLRRIEYKAGAAVVRGETILATIDPVAPTMLDTRTRALSEARRDTAAANVERARAGHNFAASELKRAERLAREKTISPQELENAQWRETSTAKDLAAAESALRQAEAELIDPGVTGTNAMRQPVTVTAPVSGRVLRVFEESSRVVASGTPLVEVGDPADLEVIIEVLSRDGAVIKPGTPVELEQWGGREPLQARVRYVEPAAFTKFSALGVEEQRVNVVADIVTPLEQRQTVGDSFRVEARIVTWGTNATLKLPSGGLFRQNGQAAAFVLRDGRAHLQPITTGHTSGIETEVLSGLKEGDSVIVYPGDRIRDGSKVKALTIAR